MDDIHAYHIQLQGQVSETDINARSPLHMVMERGGAAVTLFSIRTDQSGLIGLLRYLHALGFVVLSLTRER